MTSEALRNSLSFSHMLTPQFISGNSSFFENLLEHRFLFEIGRELVLRPDPLVVNILKSEVDAFGFDLVL